MIIYRLLVFALIMIGLFLLFRKQATHKYAKQKSRATLKKEALNEKRYALINKKISFVDRFRSASIEMLKLSKMSYAHYIKLALLFSLAGFIFGLLLNNVLLSIILAVCLSFVPFEFLKVKQSAYIQSLNDQMENVLSLVTNAYIQSGDIIQAVKDNLHRMEQPFHNLFREFIAERVFIDANLVKSIKKLRDKIDNQFFREWCDTLILCQSNRELMYILPSIIEKMADVKQIQEECNTQMYNIYKDHISVSLVVAANIPLMKFLNAEWYQLLTNTLVGQIIVAITFFIICVATAYVIKVNKPVSVL